MRKILRSLLVLFAIAFVGIAAAATFPDAAFDTDNGPLKLDRLRGKVVYVDYWASWCVPCRRAFPWMNEMQTRYKDRGLVVVAIDVDSDIAAARRFLAKHPSNFVVAYDPAGVSSDVLNLRGMPTSLLVDRNGEIVWRHVGFRESDKAKNEAKIKALLRRR